MDIERKDSVTQQVEYSVYSKEGEMLNLTYCDKMIVNINSPIKTEMLVNFNLAESLYLNGINIFDPNDPVYNDICHPFANDKSDLPLKDRRDALYQNVSLCETGCQMEGIDFKMKTVECSCDIKTSLSTETTDNPKSNFFSNMIQSTNIFITQCCISLISVKSIKGNIGMLVISGMIYLCHII